MDDTNDTENNTPACPRCNTEYLNVWIWDSPSNVAMKLEHLFPNSGLAWSAFQQDDDECTICQEPCESKNARADAGFQNSACGLVHVRVDARPLAPHVQVLPQRHQPQNDGRASSRQLLLYINGIVCRGKSWSPSSSTPRTLRRNYIPILRTRNQVLETFYSTSALIIKRVFPLTIVVPSEPCVDHNGGT